MKLIDLEPKWIVLEFGGPRVGLTFRCPHCPPGERGETTFLGVLFHNDGEAAMDDAYIRAHHDNGYIWELLGQEGFDVLTLTPSVDCSAAGHWHGFITNGEIVGGI